jgi:hypothetical protein
MVKAEIDCDLEDTAAKNVEEDQNSASKIEEVPNIPVSVLLLDVDSGMKIYF